MAARVSVFFITGLDAASTKVLEYPLNGVPTAVKFSEVVQEDASVKRSRQKISSALLFGMLVGMPLLAILACFPLLSSKFFQKYCDVPNERRQGLIFQVHDQKCDIVLYGDSTAQVGLDPVLIAKETHLITCNIAVTEATINLLGMQPLERFLAVNARPHYLIFTFSAANLLESDPYPYLSLDGVILALRYEGWIRAGRFLIMNPDRILALLSYTYLEGSKQLAGNILHKRFLPVSLDDMVTQQGTHFVLPEPPMTECQKFVGGRLLPDEKWIASLRKQFRPFADDVMVNVAPSSPCIDLFSEWAVSLANKTDNRLEAYPLDLFGDSYYHLTGAGALRYSKTVAKEILQRNDSVVLPPVQSR